MTLLNKLVQRFKDFEYRHTYVESFLDSYIATQIQVLRERHGLTQTELAKRAGMGQSQISALEDVNNSTWKISTLRKLARAFDLVLVVRFEEFGSALPDIDRFSRESLTRRPFDKDPTFANIPPVRQEGTGAELSVQMASTAPSGRVLDFSPRPRHIPMFQQSTPITEWSSSKSVAR
jgi:transcriptional regulator with XRE-family HTH domain